MASMRVAAADIRLGYVHSGVLPAVMTAVCVLLMGVLAIVWVRMQVVDLRFEVSRKAAMHEKLRTEHDRARLLVGELKTPARIERIARDRLGLMYPRPEQIRVMGPPVRIGGAQEPVEVDDIEEVGRP